MPAQHFVPKFASAIQASPRAQANALKAIAMAGTQPMEPEWQVHAAAALLIGAEWAGEACTQAEIANATGVPEAKVAKHYAALADRLKGLR